MDQRTTSVLVLMLLAAANVPGCGQRPASPTPSPDATKVANPHEVVDSPIDAKLFVEAFSIDEIRTEFPLVAGLTIAEVEAIAKQQDSLAAETNLDEMYNLSWEKRDIQDGNGWIYFWVNGKHLLHCDLVIEKGRVKSVWVMPGNREWVAFVYHRLSGSGQHEIEGRMATDRSRIETDEQLTAIKTPSHIDRLWLHSSRVTDDGMKHLPAFTNLRKLDFNYPGITEAGLQHLHKLKNLRELHLGTVALTDRGLAHVTVLKGLEELTFWHNKEITDEGLRQLKALVHLKLLRLDGTSITDRGIAHLTGLTELRELSLADCKGITDGGATTLAKMKQLHALNLLDSGITAVGAEELRTTLPNCRVIHPSVAHIPPTNRGR